MFQETWLARPRLLQKQPASPALPRLHYPLPGSPRIAVLNLLVRSEEGIRCFAPWTLHQVQRTDPEALAGPLADLIEAARLRDSGCLSMPRLGLPLVVFSSLRSGILSPDDREHLWEAFGLPFYEQVRDEHGRLLAYECDAREGFHWVGQEVVAHLPNPALCACGRAAPSKTPASARTGSASPAMTNL
jgi:hypothetical protein